MIKSFADRRTQELHAAGKASGFPPDVALSASRKLEYVELAACDPEIGDAQGSGLLRHKNTKLVVDSAAISPYHHHAITCAPSKPPFLCLLSVIASKLSVAKKE